MASVVVCPHCFLQLTVPDGIESDVRVQCPACRDQFELSEAEPRALPEVVRVEAPDYMSTTSNVLPIHERQRREREAQAARPQEDDLERPAEFSTWQTVSHVEPLVGDMQHALGGLAVGPQQSSAEPDEPKSIVGEPESEAPPTAGAIGPKQTAAELEPTASLAAGNDEVEREAADDESAQPDAESGEHPPSKSSAVTLADLRSAAADRDEQVETVGSDAPPPADKSRPELRIPQKKMVGPTFDLSHVPLSKHASATVDLGAASPSASAANTDFELDDVEMGPAQADLPLDKTVSSTTDQTVDFEEPPATPSSAKTVPDVADWKQLAGDRSDEPGFSAAGGQLGTDGQSWGDSSASAPTSADQSAAAKIIPTPGRRRKRSVVRALVGYFVFSVGGLAIGYYILLFLLGPRGDVLDVSQYMPAAVLPDSFRATPTDVAQATDSGPSSPVDTPTESPPADAPIDGSATDDAPNRPADYQVPVELPAEPPAEPLTGRADDAAGAPPVATESRYGQDRVGRDTSPAESYDAEPARFDEPAAAPLPAEAPRVIGGPSYTADELAAALEDAGAAQPGLVAGDLSDKSVRQTKGRSYATLCELAEVLTFCDDTTSARSQAVRESEALFRRTLSDAHTRDEVARIATIWIDSPNRRHGGVFLAGSTSGGEIVGDVYEYQLHADDGAVRAILSSHPLENRTDAATTQLGIVGAIVDRPSEMIVGYAGNAPQAIWVGRAIPLD